MKYGLLTYRVPHKYINIGDYIQSIAAKQFLPQVDVLVNREDLSGYNGDEISLIMNGWYMHNPSTWPPSDKIHPLLISVHLNKSKHFLINQEEILDFFSKNVPVGCRDIQTLELLRNYNIKSYLSSCLTLTLDKDFSFNGKREGVYLVDPFFNYPKFLDIINEPKKTLSNFLHGKIKLKDFLFRRKYMKKIFDKSILKNMKEVTHVYNKNNYLEEGLFEEAESLVKKYARAELVITSRIHCALPCLALNTPVIFLDAGFEHENEKSRLLGISDFFNVIKVDTKGNVLSDIEYSDKFKIENIVSNKTAHLEYTDKLKQKTYEFINSNKLR